MMENDPRNRFDDLEELRFKTNDEPDEHTTFDRSRIDVFDSESGTEPDLVFTPEPPPAPYADHLPDFKADTTDEPFPNETDLTPPDWWASTPDPKPLEDIPFELLSLDVFDEEDDGLG